MSIETGKPEVRTGFPGTQDGAPLQALKSADAYVDRLYKTVPVDYIDTLSVIARICAEGSITEAEVIELDFDRKAELTKGCSHAAAVIGGIQQERRQSVRHEILAQYQTGINKVIRKSAEIFMGYQEAGDDLIVSFASGQNGKESIGLDQAITAFGLISYLIQEPFNLETLQSHYVFACGALPELGLPKDMNVRDELVHVWKEQVLADLQS